MIVDAQRYQRQDMLEDRPSANRALSSDKIVGCNILSICMWTGIRHADIQHASLQNKVNRSQSSLLLINLIPRIIFLLFA